MFVYTTLWSENTSIDEKIIMNLVLQQPVQICAPDSPRYFNLEEANETLPLIQKITREAYDELQIVKREIENMLPSDPGSLRRKRSMNPL